MTDGQKRLLIGMIVAVVIGGVGLGIFLFVRGMIRGTSAKVMKVFENTPPEGEFESTNEELGYWRLEPDACLDGRELGFQGIAFQFSAGDPIEEIRIDNARAGDNVVAVHLADRAGTVYRAREAECKTITGNVNQTNVELNGRPMIRLDGQLEISCPDHGLRGHAKFAGCLPQSL